MIFSIIIVSMVVYIQLGWCWADALLRFNASQPAGNQSYWMSFIFWPVSMMLWDAQQQEADSDY